MSDRPWWSHVIQWGVWALLMGVLFRWMERSRTAATTSATPGLLVQPKSMLVIGIVCTAFFLGLAVLSAVVPGTSDSPLISLAFLGFAVPGVFVLLDYRNSRHVLTPTGLEYGRLLGERGQLEWSAVQRLSYSETMRWFRLEVAGTPVVRVSSMLIGLPEFARAALTAVPHEAIDAQARLVLEQTAEGNLPTIWG